MKIFLDATLEKQIDFRTFRGKLANGHHFSAILLDKQDYVEREAQVPATVFGTSTGADFSIIGESVKVEMSPYDMSKGVILGRSQNLNNE